MFLLTFNVLFTSIACLDELEEQVEVKNDHVIGRVDVLEKTYSMSFWLKVKSVTKKSNLLYVESKEEGKKSKMILNLITKPRGKLQLKAKIGKEKKRKMLGKIKFGKSYHVKISQKLIKDQYVFLVKINYKTVLEMANENPKEEKNVVIYAGHGETFIEATLTDFDYPKHQTCPAMYSETTTAASNTTRPPSRLGVMKAGLVDEGKED